MKVGVKIWPDRLHQVTALSKFADFIELMVTPSLKKVKKASAEFTIHAPHTRFKMNPADKRLDKWNTKLMEHTIKIADELKAKIIVLHAGEFLNKSCSEETAIKFIRRFDDYRIVIENQGYPKPLNNTPEKLKRFKKELGLDICFDFSHAIVTSYRSGLKDYRPMVKKFLKLKPKYFHICDGYYDGKDHHFDLGKGKYDLDFIKSCIPKSAMAALETKTHKIPAYKRQVEFLKK